MHKTQTCTRPTQDPQDPQKTQKDPTQKDPKRPRRFPLQSGKCLSLKIDSVSLGIKDAIHPASRYYYGTRKDTFQHG